MTFLVRVCAEGNLSTGVCPAFLGCASKTQRAVLLAFGARLQIESRICRPRVIA